EVLAWQAVGQEVLEQQLAEASARLRRSKCLLEALQVVRPLEHLTGRLIDLAEALVNRGGLLGDALQPQSHAPVHVAEPAIERALEAAQALVHRTRALG